MTFDFWEVKHGGVLIDKIFALNTIWWCLTAEHWWRYYSTPTGLFPEVWSRNLSRNLNNLSKWSQEAAGSQRSRVSHGIIPGQRGMWCCPVAAFLPMWWLFIRRWQQNLMNCNSGSPHTFPSSGAVGCWEGSAGARFDPVSFSSHPGQSLVR